MAPQDLQLLRAESSKSLPALLEAKEHLKHKSPLSVVPDREPRRERVKRVFLESLGLGMTKIEQENGERSDNDTERSPGLGMPEGMARSPKQTSDPDAFVGMKGKFETKLAMTSRMSFFNDRIISPDLMRAMAIREFLFLV